MPTIIAIETSSELASAALLHGEKIFTRDISGVQTHSQTILPMLQSLLVEAGMTLARCDAIAFGSGPGSFTGVRTACGIAQGLAFGVDKPVVPVITLQAMAQACHETGGASDVLAVLDARMGEVYWAQYRFAGEWEVIIEPTLSTPDGVRPVGDVVACGNGFIAYASAFEGKSFAGNAMKNVMPHAFQVAQLARRAFERGEGVAARDAQPLYLRNKVALTTSERLMKVTA
jgi:tRNA threonylcarbamoyladenosine biosynthesis protein TsaB